MAAPVVLLHAFPLSSRMWDPVRSLLPDGLDVVAPDFRGSGGVPLGAEAPSLDVLADDVAALIRARAPAAVVVGLSMGGYVAMALARRHPALLAGLVLADTKAGADDDAARTNRLAVADALVTENSTRVLVEKTLPTLLGETTTRSRPDVVASVRSLVEQTAPESAAWWQRAMAGRPDSSDTLRALDVPALVVVGSEDGLAPLAQAQAMAVALAQRQPVVLPDAGHLSAIEAPAAFARVLMDFVAALP